jgi:uncharacterized protein (AIM24 family)/RNA polymerase subunit RPABC4/transcription elongation factor Spt4
MFCVNCGSAVLEDQNFCRMCGSPVKHSGASAAPPQASLPPKTPAPPAPPPTGHGISGRCQWCGAQVDGRQQACPYCGAALQEQAATAASGWTQMPPRKDMAKLQVGRSSCQIEGVYVPVADMNLAPGDTVYFTHHVLLWKDTQVNITCLSLKGAWKRVFAGLPLVMTQAEGPGHIAFSKDEPGELIPVPLHPGQSIDVREHILLVATSSVAYDWFDTNVWFETKQGDDREIHYPVGRYMDRFTAGATPGLLLLHAAGNIFIRNLAPGETILVRPTALVFKDPTVDMQLHFEHPGTVFATWGSWGNRYLWLRLQGPGRVAVQTVFDRIEGESRSMTRWSNATARRW